MENNEFAVCQDRQERTLPEGSVSVDPNLGFVNVPNIHVARNGEGNTQLGFAVVFCNRLLGYLFCLLKCVSIVYI